VQKGNPVLKHIRCVPWEYADIVPDYQMGQTCCALFLRLQNQHSKIVKLIILSKMHD
jgi:DNA repair protein Rad10